MHCDMHKTSGTHYRNKENYLNNNVMMTAKNGCSHYFLLVNEEQNLL